MTHDSHHSPPHSPKHKTKSNSTTIRPSSSSSASASTSSFSRMTSFPIFPFFPISHSSPPPPPPSAGAAAGATNTTTTTRRPSLSSTQSSSSPLFDNQSPELLHSIPGSLHLASDASIERLIHRFGAVSLLRQLAKDVAERDAFISNVKFHYESREAVFRDLLRQHGLDPVLANTKLAKQRSVLPPSFSSSYSSSHPSTAPPPPPNSAPASSVPLLSSHLDEPPTPLFHDKPFLQSKISSAINEPFLPPPSSSSFSSSSPPPPPPLSPTLPPVSFPNTTANGSPSPPSFPSPKPTHTTDLPSPTLSPTYPSMARLNLDDPSCSFSHSAVELSDSFSPLADPPSSNLPSSAAANLTFPGSMELDNLIPKHDLPPTLRNDWSSHTILKPNQTFDQFGFINNLPTSSNPSSKTFKPLQSLSSSVATSSFAHNPDSTLSPPDTFSLSNNPQDAAQMKRWDEYIQKYSIKYGKFDENSTDLLGKCRLGKTKRGSKKRFERFRRLVKQGVPVPYRPKVWLECSAARQLHVPGYYDELLAKSDTSDPSNRIQIDQDIKRTLVGNVFFGGNGPGVPKLRRVLLAYSLHNPEVGYCQGMNVIAAFFLLIYASEEDVFYLIMSLIENYLPKNYFTEDLLGSRADQIVLKEYVSLLLPQISSHLETLKVDLEAVTLHWFLSLYTDTVNTKLGFRILDLFFCDGYPCLFRVALDIIYTLKDEIMACNSSFAVYSLLCDLRNYPFELDSFINNAAEKWKYQIHENDLQRRHTRAMSLL
ncbi:GTPase activating protein [Schizosaccharomyces octosporus yFS286]|uniref:GTPase activating protein n=1 Tax=Schizosaccharomyces octosporus (strain yFS286) TaxID=483514 RepID=S9RKT0_SCHOY|nr:GTPase activating protein [Schizosaccharomyces octosporus yFS286]EPX74554.1 GTPase activating protein [Schizosaccharomyces octosporus yFS286]